MVEVQFGETDMILRIHIKERKILQCWIQTVMTGDSVGNVSVV